MRISQSAAVAAVVAGLGVAAPSYAANTAFQFTVTADQNGPSAGCSEIIPIPCSITAHWPSYILGTVTIDAPFAAYGSSSPPLVVSFDDGHLVSFVSAPNLDLGSWPQPASMFPQTANIGLNVEGGNSLSGFITLTESGPHGSDILVMTGMNNLWTGYWITPDGPVHQFWAKSVKL